MFNSSPSPEAPTVFKIVKMSDGVVEPVIVISETMEGVQSHFSGRTLICGGPDCPLCLEGRPTRYLGFVVVTWRLGRGLLRLTSGPATQLMGMSPRPGLSLLIRQKNRRSPIEVRKSGVVSVLPASVVTQLELLNCLSHLFGVGSVDFNADYPTNVAALQVAACKCAVRERLPLNY